MWGRGTVRLERQNRVGRPGCEGEQVHASFPRQAGISVCGRPSCCVGYFREPVGDKPGERII